MNKELKKELKFLIHNRSFDAVVSYIDTLRSSSYYSGREDEKNSHLSDLDHSKKVEAENKQMREELLHIAKYGIIRREILKREDELECRWCGTIHNKKHNRKDCIIGKLRQKYLGKEVEE